MTTPVREPTKGQISAAGAARLAAARTVLDTCKTNDGIDGALTIPNVIKESTFGRTSIYKAIAAGELITRKHGRRTIVLRSDFNKFMASLPVIPAKSQAV